MIQSAVAADICESFAVLYVENSRPRVIEVDNAGGGTEVLARALIHFLPATQPTEFYRNDKVDFRNYRSLRFPDDFSFRSDISRRSET